MLTLVRIFSSALYLLVCGQKNESKTQICPLPVTHLQLLDRAIVLYVVAAP